MMRLFNAVKRHIEALRESQDGLAFIEFAFSISVLLLMFLGSIEVTRFVLIIQKMEKTVASVTDVIGQTDSSTTQTNETPQLNQLMQAIDNMMSPYSSGNNDPNIKLILTYVKKTGAANPKIGWQYCANSGALVVNSKIGTAVGADADLTSLPNFTMVAGEEALFGEMYYRFTPITTANVVPTTTLYRTATQMPRYGTLSSFTYTCP